GRVRAGRDPRARAGTAGADRRLPGVRVPPATALDRDGGVHAVAGRPAALRRLHRQAVDLECRGGRRPDLPGRRGRGRDRCRPGLLPEGAVRAVRPGGGRAGGAAPPGAARLIGYRSGNSGRGAGPGHRPGSALRPRADGGQFVDRRVGARMQRLAVVTILAMAAFAIAPATAGARTLSLGMCRPDVHRLQHRLGARSYLPLSYTPGCYTYRTEQAVMAFQGWARLARSGVAGW